MSQRRPIERPPVAPAVDLAYPGAGDWLVQNSPADRVPSHGTTLLATSYAIDFVPVDARGRTAKVTAETFVRPEPPAAFPGFGRPVHAPVAGRIVAVENGAVDHRAYRGLPSLWYALTQARRVAGGWGPLAGNHVLIEVHPKLFVALCHLRRGSIPVRVGDEVRRGDPVGECGNSGNSTEPHVHVQAMDQRDPRVARALPVSFENGLPRSGRIVAGAPSGKRSPGERARHVKKPRDAEQKPSGGRPQGLGGGDNEAWTRRR